MAGKRSLEILVEWRTDRPTVIDRLEAGGIEIAEVINNFVQVRNTTPATIRRLTRGIALRSISEGFSR